ncbi:MAG: type II toxin-antitoxin system prevent-host-death family antitoxin [Opitutales bacterium]
MNRKIGIFEAKTKLSELCSKVGEGEAEYVITRRGKPIARLVGAAPAETGSPRGILERMAETEKAFGPISDDEPEFPDVWLERKDSNSSPFDDEDKEANPNETAPKS